MTVIFDYFMRNRATKAAPRLSGSELIMQIEESDDLLFSMWEITEFPSVVNAYSFLLFSYARSTPSVPAIGVLDNAF